MMHLLAELLLVGTIAGPHPVAVLRSGPNTVSLPVGGNIEGWTVKRIDAKQIVIGSPTSERVLRAGDYLVAEQLLRGIDVNGDHVRLSPEVHRYITETSLPTIVNEATATQVPGGWRIWNFDRGSVFDLVGLEDGDVVQAIDGAELTTPQRSVELLQAARGKRAFAVTLLRRGEKRTITVEVTNGN